MFQIERDAKCNRQKTRRGKGNLLLVSVMLPLLYKWYILDYQSALNNNLQVDDTQNTFAGVLNGRYRVYVDPYAANVQVNTMSVDIKVLHLTMLVLSIDHMFHYKW